MSWEKAAHTDLCVPPQDSVAEVGAGRPQYRLNSRNFYFILFRISCQGVCFIYLNTRKYQLSYGVPVPDLSPCTGCWDLYCTFGYDEPLSILTQGLSGKCLRHERDKGTGHLVMQVFLRSLDDVQHLLWLCGGLH